MGKTFRKPKHENWNDEDFVSEKEGRSRDRKRYKEGHKRREKMGCLDQMDGNGFESDFSSYHS